MEKNGISELLKRRGAWLKGETPDYDAALARQELTRAISYTYGTFERVRDAVIGAAEAGQRQVLFEQNFSSETERTLVDLLLKHGLVRKAQDGHFVPSDGGEVRRYIAGSWLEELAWLAAMEAGSEEAVFGQVLGWNVNGYAGENEIDLIARRKKHLCFISCKALRSVLDIQDRKHRNRLMDAVHEADNLVDHFGKPQDRVAVLVTTDLYDEIKGAVRYNALMGKAAVLDVRIIALEDLGWDRLVDVMRNMWIEAEHKS
jgi:hypothetical protein